MVTETPPAEVVGTKEAETKEESVEELKARVAELTKTKAEAEEAMKAAHRSLNLKDKELKEAQRIRELIEDVSSKLAVHDAVIGELAKAKEAEEEDESRLNRDESKPKTSLDATLRKYEIEALTNQLKAMSDEVKTLVTDAGFDIVKSPELEDVRDAFHMAYKYGDRDAARKGLKKAQLIVAAKKEKETVVETKKEEKKETEEQLKARLKAEILKELGLTKPEAEGLAAGASSPTLDALLKKDDRKMSQKELREHKEAILSAYKSRPAG